MSVASQGAVAQRGEGQTSVHQNAERTVAKGRMEKSGMCLAGKEREDGSHRAAFSGVGQRDDRRCSVGRGIEVCHRSARPRVGQGHNGDGSAGRRIGPVQIRHRAAFTGIRQGDDGGGTH